MFIDKNIRYLRKKANMSQDALAERLGYKSFTTIQKWESGVAEPPFKTLLKLSDMFSVNSDDLLNVDLEVRDSLMDLAKYKVREDSLTETHKKLIEECKDLTEDQAAAFLEFLKRMV